MNLPFTRMQLQIQFLNHQRLKIQHDSQSYSLLSINQIIFIRFYLNPDKSATSNDLHQCVKNTFKINCLTEPKRF